MVRFGVVGTNWITEAFIKGARHQKDFKLAAVYSRSEDRAADFAGKFGVDTVFTDLEEMAKSDAIDAVYLASPNSLHASQAIMLMENGKHVLCEKAIASNSRELNDMIRAAKENQVVLMEALKSTLMPNFKAVQQNLGKIGTIRRYFASYCQYSSRYDKYKEGTVLNAFNPEFSAGSLMDIGIYCIYPLVVLFGEPKSIQANGYILESGVDGEGSLILKYDEMDAVIMFSKITDSTLPSEIHGENGCIRIDKISTPTNVEILYRDGSSEDLSVKQLEDNMFYEAEEFITLIQQGKLESVNNSLENSRITMKILDEARLQMGVSFPSDK
ncbi:MULTISPECIES: Gfo/Idh/MocA family oxidoreductase [unclassified Mesobacillus]|uniref:Gfo/Idh/MocA family protein n=1 Tax=unclassified Mesobacillus TaxID=2675270 RepID=UPI00203C4149|nr:MULTISPECIES: Gfo/Idh/MocA family oxidoreductase [unclassified Mesobacillus]MCM3125099.1 Gfo/Idh/MocA family oxidoreductase [Mesobacillus sp. MER 33]MCM3235141.1 Gfo/Idh/MocA family oxidoreductase [Mesobacillus sp. MER 48]